ncbi:MAG: DUF58 domain-containing protein [Dethiobacteria bacterium]
MLLPDRSGEPKNVLCQGTCPRDMGKLYETKNLNQWWWSFYLALAFFIIYLFMPHRAIIYSFYTMLTVTFISLPWLLFPDPLVLEMNWGKIRVNAGGNTSLRMVLTNNSFLPWSNVKIILTLPEGLGRKKYVQQLAIGPRQKKYFDLEVDCLRRGVYRLPYVDIYRHDIFGMGCIRERWQGYEEVVVYPKFVELIYDRFPRNRPFGQTKVKEKAYEDYSSLDSLRDYLPGDPLRRIEWKATARYNRLQVKEYELTATGMLYIMPDINADVHGIDEHGEPTEEITISLAATLARAALENNTRIGFISADCIDMHLGFYGRHQTPEFILERLARLERGSRIPVGLILSKYNVHLLRGSMIVVITPRLADEVLIRNLYLAHYRGCRVLVLRQNEIGGVAGKEDDLLVGPLERIGIEVVSA